MERFTQRARRVLSLAQEEAERLQHTYIDTEHMLLGLMREQGGVASRVLRDLGVELTKLSDLVENMSRAGKRTQNTPMELSPGTKKILELAVDEARRMGHHYIGTEHLLLGLVRQTEGVAIEVLKRLGIAPEEIRRQTRRVLQERPQQAQKEEGAVQATEETSAVSPSPLIRHVSRSHLAVLEMLRAGSISVERAVETMQLANANDSIQVQKTLLDIFSAGKLTAVEIIELFKLVAPADVPVADVENQAAPVHISLKSGDGVPVGITLPFEQFLRLLVLVTSGVRAGQTGKLYEFDADGVHLEISVDEPKDEPKTDDEPPKE